MEVIMVTRGKFRGISASVVSLAWAFGAFDALSMNSVVPLPTNSGTRPYQPMGAVDFYKPLAALTAENAELKAQLSSTLAQMQKFETDLLAREQKFKVDFEELYSSRFSSLESRFESRLAALTAENADLKAQLSSTLAQVQRFEAFRRDLAAKLNLVKNGVNELYWHVGRRWYDYPTSPCANVLFE
ncbi:MAG: hypothetical protein LBS14_00530 [Holosporaceae bacterium]|jgi:uncharacterized small protein (DUF1192 family)|nr:hypothetical protein [Holosporaceae bacterium]